MTASKSNAPAIPALTPESTYLDFRAALKIAEDHPETALKVMETFRDSDHFFGGNYVGGLVRIYPRHAALGVEMLLETAHKFKEFCEGPRSNSDFHFDRGIGSLRGIAKRHPELVERIFEVLETISPLVKSGETEIADAVKSICRLYPEYGARGLSLLSLKGNGHAIGTMGEMCDDNGSLSKQAISIFEKIISGEIETMSEPRNLDTVKRKCFAEMQSIASKNPAFRPLAIREILATRYNSGWGDEIDCVAHIGNHAGVVLSSILSMKKDFNSCAKGLGPKRYQAVIEKILETRAEPQILARAMHDMDIFDAADLRDVLKRAAEEVPKFKGIDKMVDHAVAIIRAEKAFKEYFPS